MQRRYEERDSSGTIVQWEIRSPYAHACRNSSMTKPIPWRDIQAARSASQSTRGR